MDDLVAIRVVVVGQLFTGLDVPAGANPDVPSDDLAVAVRAARMIDEASDVATDGGVAHPAAVHRKAPDLAALQITRFAFVALFVIDQLTVIGNDPGILVDGVDGKNAPSVELRATPDDTGQ